MTMPRAGEWPGAASRGSCGEDSRREVAIAAVADDEHHGGVLEPLRDLQRDPAGPRGGDPREQAFLAREPARHVLGVVLRDLHGLVDTPGLEDPGLVGLGPLADARDARALGGLRAQDADCRVLLLQ